MASYAVQTSDTEDQALEWAASQAAQGSSVEEFLQVTVRQLLEDMVRRWRAAAIPVSATDVAVAYARAPAEIQWQVVGLLGAAGGEPHVESVAEVTMAYPEGHVVPA